MNRVLGLLLLFSAGFVHAEGLPLDDKARFERALEEKVDSVLTHMLGPNQAKVVIDASIDFTRLESVEYKSSSLNEEEQKKAGQFLWQSLQNEEMKKPQILPGFSVPEDIKGKGDQGTVSASNQKVERQLTYPTAFLKRLVVTVVLNQSIPAAKQENVREVVTNLLDLKAPRGDSLTLVPAQFPPPWQTVWYSQESASFVVKYAAVTLLSVLALVVLGMSLMRLAGAMSAVASAQMHQVSLEMPKMPGLPEPGKLEGGAESRAEGKGELGMGAEAELVFDVKPGQVDTLIEMIGGEEASNIALVVAHLPPETRKGFLSKLPSATMAAVLDHMAQVKFVDPEMIANLKEELERRLRGALGGLPQVLALVDQADLKTKKELLEHLSRSNPALAREVRRRILLFDDLVRLSAQDFSYFALAVRTEDWASALPGSDAMKDLVKAQLPAKSWQILEQTMAARRATPERVREAQERVVAQALKLIADGRIANPTANLPEMLPAAEPEAAANPAEGKA